MALGSKPENWFRTIFFGLRGLRVYIAGTDIHDNEEHLAKACKVTIVDTLGPLYEKSSRREHDIFLEIASEQLKFCGSTLVDKFCEVIHAVAHSSSLFLPYAHSTRHLLVRLLDGSNRFTQRE